MAMRRLFNILLLFIIGQLCIVNCMMAAQPKPVKPKTLISEAKAAIKNGKGQADVEEKLLEIVNREDVTQAQRAEIYFMAEELERSMNGIENEKLYLKQAYDTIRFFSTILRMHQYLLACDSVESLPDAKGNVTYRYRAKSRDIMRAYHTNLLNGGKFLLKREKFAEAFPYFDIYLETSRGPILGDIPTIKNDTLLPRIAYWATVSAYNANQPRKALKFMDEAIAGADSTMAITLQENKVRCYEVLGDRDEWMINLLAGSTLYPQHDYFFLHLMDVYSSEKMYDEGIALVRRMRSEVGDKAIYALGECQMYQGKQDYDACIVAADNALRHDSLLIEAQYNKGVAYLNKAVAFAETVCTDIRNPQCRKDRQTLLQLYRNALNPMEQVRRQAPQDTARWASPLYRIYLNLNMGKEFAEMEKILNAK